MTDSKSLGSIPKPSIQDQAGSLPPEQGLSRIDLAVGDRFDD
jgi:hypothetical protein